MPEIKLDVDGRDIPLNQFVRTFLENTILGMVLSLSGVGPDPKRIVLTMDRMAPEAKAATETKAPVEQATGKRKPKRSA
jgi:hypothetical protein